MTVEVNQSLATLSDQLILATVLLYLAAMISYALELAFGRTRAAPAVKQAVLVAAGSTLPRQDVSAVGATKKTWAETAGPFAVVLTGLGCAANLGAILTLGLAVDRWP